MATTVTNAMSRILSKKNYTIAQACLSGKASLRMKEVTGREAKTIHRLLEVEWDSSDKPVFRRNTENPLTVSTL